jgi:fructose 5-dehydrogenase small subunit
MLLTRRGLLLSTMVLLAPSARLRAIVARSRSTQPTSLDEFVELSQRLLGRSKLDREVAQIYLNALLVDANNSIYLATLVQMNGNPTPEQAALSRTIIEWWYTGVYTIDDKPRLATHPGALVWSALGMPAPGTCAGQFGAWSQPPLGMA